MLLKGKRGEGGIEGGSALLFEHGYNVEGRNCLQTRVASLGSVAGLGINVIEREERRVRGYLFFFEHRCDRDEDRCLVIRATSLKLFARFRIFDRKLNRNKGS